MTLKSVCLVSCGADSMFRPRSLCSVLFFFIPIELDVGLVSEIYSLESVRRVENVLICVVCGLFLIPV